MNHTILPVARVQFPAMAISRDFSLADHTCCLVHSLERLKARPTTNGEIQSVESGEIYSI